MAKTCFIYLRATCDSKQREIEMMHRQMHECLMFAEKEDYKLDGIFTDTIKCKTPYLRQGFKMLENSIELDKPDAVLVSGFDRLTRNKKILKRILKSYEDRKVGLISIQDFELKKILGRDAL